MPSAVSRLRSQARQNGAVVEAMMPKVSPSARRYRSAGAGPPSCSGSTGRTGCAMTSSMLVPRHHVVHRPPRGTAHVHVLDETDLRPMLAAELEQVHHLVVVESANHHAC